MGRHTVYWADVVNEAFAHTLVMDTGSDDYPSKRLDALVSFQHPNEGRESKVLFQVRVAGEIKYEGESLKEAVDTYNKF